MKTKKDLRNRIRRLIQNWAVPFGCGLFFLFLLRFVFLIGIVPTASMEPTIREGSFIFGIRIIDKLALDNVVVFEHKGRLLVKRIAALPGDEVVIGGETVTVPDKHYFMLGDNTDASVDSRDWDEPFVPRGCIVALLPHYSMQLSKASHLAPYVSK